MFPDPYARGRVEGCRGADTDAGAGADTAVDGSAGAADGEDGDDGPATDGGGTYTVRFAEADGGGEGSTEDAAPVSYGATREVDDHVIVAVKSRIQDEQVWMCRDCDARRVDAARFEEVRCQ